jgi:hypothetical protein
MLWESPTPADAPAANIEFPPGLSRSLPDWV